MRKGDQLAALHRRSAGASRGAPVRTGRRDDPRRESRCLSCQGEQCGYTFSVTRWLKERLCFCQNASRFDPSVNAEITAIFRQLIQVCRSASLEDCDTAYYQARFFSSLLRVSSVAPTRQASRAGSPSAEAAASAAAASGLQGMPSDALISGLDMNRLIGDSVGLQHDVVADGFPDLDQELTIDGLLQESHDWFSVDLMAHMNDPLYAPPAVITLPTTFIGNG